jgi:hypothetical protein
VATATTTALYDIDVATDKLFLQSPPNDGTLREVGPLGVNADAANGFDIGGASGVAYALLTSAGRTQLYRINIATGAATALGAFSGPATGFTVGLGF